MRFRIQIILIVIFFFLVQWSCKKDDGPTSVSLPNQAPSAPSSPTPANNATSISTAPTLIWSCSDPDSDPLTYDVYFGTDNPPSTKVSTSQSGISLARTGLSNSTAYYWKVVAKDGHSNSTTGTVWKFTTGAVANQAPASPSSPNPANNATSISTALILSWTCSDPDSDPLTYDVYFGTDNPPSTKVSLGQSGTSLARNGLSNSTAYYWKVVAKDDHSNSTDGIVWSFTTSGQSDSSCTGTPTVTYANKTYNTVQIGTQCWFKENIDVGTRIAGSATQSNNSTIEKYCYDDDTAACRIYGGLYQWDEAMQYTTTEGSQGICPTGWHIPTYSELQTLGTTVNNNSNALKEVGQGYGSGAGTNTSGFSALLSGHRLNTGSFHGVGYDPYFWSSTEDNATIAYYLGLTYDGSSLYFHYNGKSLGSSVRCLKD